MQDPPNQETNRECDSTRIRLLFEQYKLAIDQCWQQRRLEPTLVAIFLALNTVVSAGFFTLVGRKISDTSDAPEIQLMALGISILALLITLIWDETWARHGDTMLMRDSIARDLEARLRDEGYEYFEMQHIERECFFHNQIHNFIHANEVFPDRRPLASKYSARRLYGLLPKILLIFWTIMSLWPVVVLLQRTDLWRLCGVLFICFLAPFLPTILRRLSAAISVIYPKLLEKTRESLISLAGILMLLLLFALAVLFDE
ncbi:MAG: hypothetical protein AB1696_17075 [Planctomycetota bacterium]